MNYESRIKNRGKSPIVILHGWGTDMSGKKYQELEILLEKKGFRVFAPDLPGFGKEPLKKLRMNLDDYVEFVKLFMEKNKIKKSILIGHSFGGRIAAKFAFFYPMFVYKLILTGAPLVRQRLTFRKKIVYLFSKTIGKVILILFPDIVIKNLRRLVYLSLGEWDYYKAGQLRETFKEIISEDLKSILPHITVPTLVVWGEDDTFVDISVGKMIARLVKNGQLIVIPGATHKIVYEDPKRFADSIIPFLI